MQTDKQLFELIKETYHINPNKNFVVETENNLRQMASRIKRNRIIKQISFASGGLAFCVIAMSWLILFNGSDVLYNHLSSYGEENIKSPSDQKEPLNSTHSTEHTQGNMDKVTLSNGKEEIPPKTVSVEIVIPYAPIVEGTHQVVELYIEDMTRSMTNSFETFSITQTEERTIELVIPYGEKAGYKIIRDDVVIEDEEVSYPEE